MILAIGICAGAEAMNRVDILELETGYRSGESKRARPEEPRPQFDPNLRLSDRRAAKATELGVSERTIHRWQRLYAEGGDLALIDNRAARWDPSLSGLDPRWIATCQQVLLEDLNGSKTTIKSMLAKVDARLECAYPDERVPVPSRAMAYRAVKELTRGRGTFNASTKARRSIANRPRAPYGRLVADRPGEYVLLDTTPLNVFGIVPVTAAWMRAELTVAM